MTKATKIFRTCFDSKIEQQCQELLSLDVIEPSYSPWPSPVVPITKKYGSLHLYIDYHQLNSITKPDCFPLHSLQDMVFNVDGMHYFTTIGLIKGYYQVPSW